MNQNIWGPHLWFSLHTISFNYPLKPTEKDKDEYKNFFMNLQNVIPCSVCKKNYIRHLNEHPIKDYLNTRKFLVYWVIDMHNMVNAEIGKKILSYEIVLKKYEDVYKKKIILDENTNDINDINNNYYSSNKINYNYLINGIFFIFILLLIINFISMLVKSKNMK
jgi:hypothetical protein